MMESFPPRDPVELYYLITLPLEKQQMRMGTQVEISGTGTGATTANCMTLLRLSEKSVR
jgi:hypothetical protein